MAKKIVALDVLTEILKKVYAKAKKYTDDQIAIEVGSLRSLIGTNREDITTLKNTTRTQQESINGLQSKVETAESNITKLQSTTGELSSSVAALQSKMETAESNIATLQGELATVKSDVAVLQGKVYDYLGNDEIDTVFNETEEGAV